jgi:hypothetical protein
LDAIPGPLRYDQTPFGVIIILIIKILSKVVPVTQLDKDKILLEIPLIY